MSKTSRRAWLTGVVVALAAGIGGQANASDTENLCLDHQLQPSPISIPADDAPKQTPDNPLDEWYWNGLLHTLDGKEYSYDVFLFRFTVGGENLLWGQANVTDLQTGVYHQGSYLVPGLYTPSTNGFDLSIPLAGAPAATGGGGKDDHVTASTNDGIAFDLHSTSLENPLIEFAGGHANYVDPETGVEAGDNWYYSRPKLVTAGTITVDGRTEPVYGESWFDREWHACCFNGPVAWDWYSVQLDDGSSYMLYDIYVPGHRDQVMSLTANYETNLPWCTQNVLTANQFSIGHSGQWTSPHTGNIYPTLFTLDVPSQNTHIEVRPRVDDQEATAVPSFFSPWYEGGATVTATKDGRTIGGQAFLELFGYLPGTP